MNADAGIEAAVTGRVRGLLADHGAFATGGVAVVAVSGGVDSMVLLEVMGRLSGDLGLRLHVAHLDHGLRDSSSADGDFVEAEAARRGWPCTRSRREVGPVARRERLSVEAAARRVRYEFLDEVAARVGAAGVALGHHADDQAETVLLRLVRGSGATGLSAMSVVRDGRYVRPLLTCRRLELVEFARAAGISHREDETNRDLCLARNRVRHQLLPLLRQLNPAVVDALNRTARLLSDEDEWLRGEANRAVTAVLCSADAPDCGSTGLALDARVLLGYHIALQRRIVRALIEGLSGRGGPFGFDHVEAVLQVARTDAARVVEVARGLAAERVGDRLVLSTGPGLAVDAEVRVPGALHVPARSATLRLECHPAAAFESLRGDLGGPRAAFDGERLGSRLLLRGLRPGDRFQPFGMEGSKKISDFLIDARWPRLLRGDVLVLTRPDGEIVWLVGLRADERYRVHGDSRSVVLASWTRRNDPERAGHDRV